MILPRQNYMVQHNYTTNSSVENFKEHAQKLRLSTFVKASFFGTCLLFLLRKVTALSLMFFYVVHDYIRTDQLK